MARTFLRRAYDELLGISRIVMDSVLDWTIVRFLTPKDGPAKGDVQHGFYGNLASLRGVSSRSHAARRTTLRRLEPAADAGRGGRCRAAAEGAGARCGRAPAAGVPAAPAQRRNRSAVRLVSARSPRDG